MKNHAKYRSGKLERVVNKQYEISRLRIQKIIGKMDGKSPLDSLCAIAENLRYDVKN
jgi:hypothetical protein